MFAFSKLLFLISNKGSLPSTLLFLPILCILQSPPRCVIETKALQASSQNPTGQLVLSPQREACLLRDPWQNAKWQHAIFLKVNSKTTAVSHLQRPWRLPGQEGSKRMPGAGTALLQSSTSSLQAPISGSPFLNWPSLQTTLREEMEETGPYPNKARRRVLSGVLAFLCLISTARRPAQVSVCPSSNLSPSCLATSMGATGDRTSQPFSSHSGLLCRSPR